MKIQRDGTKLERSLKMETPESKKAEEDFSKNIRKALMK